MTTVLHLIDTGGTGGAETVYLDIVRNLDPARWRFIGVVPDRDWMYERLREHGIETVVAVPRSPFDIGYVRQLVRTIREQRVDIIHGHLFRPSVNASFLGMLLKKPVVGTIHGQIDMSPHERLRALKLALLNRASRVVFVSEPLRQYYLQITSLRPDVTAVVTNGVDMERFTPGTAPGIRAELGIGADDFVVGAVGNANHAKGFDILLRAAALLRDLAPGYRFLVVGEAFGSLGQELLALRRELGLEGVLSFTGFRSDVPELMRAMDLYAMSSRQEGFSLTTVEAMATGLPVVSTRCGGPEQILTDGEHGLLVDTESPEQLARAIHRLRQDAAERRRLGENARREAARRFSLATQLAAYETLYRQVLAEQRSR